MGLLEQDLQVIDGAILVEMKMPFKARSENSTAKRYFLRAALRGIRCSIRGPRLLIRFLVFSDLPGVASLLWGASFISGIVQVVSGSYPIVLAAVCIGMIALHALLARAFLWAYRPDTRLRKLLPSSLSLYIVVQLLKLVEFAQRHSGGRTPDMQTTAGGTTNPARDERKPTRGSARVVLRLFSWGLRMFPQTRSNLFSTILLSWAALTLAVVIYFAIVFHSLARVGHPVVEGTGLLSGFWHNLASSMALFTSAPVARVSPTGVYGLLLSGIEAVDALLLLGLFLALIVRLVPRESEEKLHEIELVLADMHDRVEKEMSVALETIGSPPNEAPVSNGDVSSDTHEQERGVPGT